MPAEHTALFVCAGYAFCSACGNDVEYLWYSPIGISTHSLAILGWEKPLICGFSLARPIAVLLPSLSFITFCQQRTVGPHRIPLSPLPLNCLTKWWWSSRDTTVLAAFAPDLFVDCLLYPPLCSYHPVVRLLKLHFFHPCFLCVSSFPSCVALPHSKTSTNSKTLPSFEPRPHTSLDLSIIRHGLLAP